LDSSKQIRNHKADAPARRVYLRPQLREFGHVGQLTQSGTGFTMEGVAGQSGMCQGAPNKSRC
jgi:hypothetical protein